MPGLNIAYEDMRYVAESRTTDAHASLETQLPGRWRSRSSTASFPAPRVDRTIIAIGEAARRPGRGGVRCEASVGVPQRSGGA
jgi:hypothetical protein